MKKFISYFFYIYYLILSERISSYNVEQISNDLLKSKYRNDLYLSFYKIPFSLMTFTTNVDKLLDTKYLMHLIMIIIQIGKQNI